ncbi:MAG: DUF2145 domain-containing protein [Sulfuricaulis sp.]
MNAKKLIGWALTLLLFLTSPGYAVSTAGSSAGNTADTVPTFSAEETISFAKKVEKTVAAKGARVFLISRVGRSPKELPEGIGYTHTGIGVYSLIEKQDGSKVPGYVMYNLYQRTDKPDRSDLVRDYPADFFTGVFELKAGIVIPSPELQKRLLEVIASDTYRNLHNPRYSVIANPFNDKYQNCTEHTLDVLNAAIYQTGNMGQLKANAKAYFTPQKVKVGPFKLLLGSIMSEDVTLSDHDGGPVVTATFETIAKYLENYSLVSEQFVIAH